jgi:MFS transporter, SP family, solute carrier family 2 (facilitated glucose transporter), member 3
LSVLQSSWPTYSCHMARAHSPQSFTKYGWAVCVWLLVISFQVCMYAVHQLSPDSLAILKTQYGFHISSLNQIQASLTCRDASGSIDIYYGLPTCIPMSDVTFSVVTSVYTIGGLLGSMTANIAMDRFGRKEAVQISSLLYAIGAGVMGLSPVLSCFMVGRFAHSNSYSF